MQSFFINHNYEVIILTLTKFKSHFLSQFEIAVKNIKLKHCKNILCFQ